MSDTKTYDICYAFDVDTAVKHGVNEAIFLYNLKFWLTKNKANNHHAYDGYFWSYNSVRAYQELFPFWTSNQLRTIISKLNDEGIIKSGCYNKAKYDKTKWYTIIDLSIFDARIPFVENHKSNGDNSQIELLKSTDRVVEKHEPIPDINTDENKCNPDSLKTTENNTDEIKREDDLKTISENDFNYDKEEDSKTVAATLPRNDLKTNADLKNIPDFETIQSYCQKNKISEYTMYKLWNKIKFGKIQYWENCLKTAYHNDVKSAKKYDLKFFKKTLYIPNSILARGNPQTKSYIPHPEDDFEDFKQQTYQIAMFLDPMLLNKINNREYISDHLMSDFFKIFNKQKWCDKQGEPINWILELLSFLKNHDQDHLAKANEKYALRGWTTDPLADEDETSHAPDDALREV